MSQHITFEKIPTGPSGGVLEAGQSEVVLAGTVGGVEVTAGDGRLRTVLRATDRPLVAFFDRRRPPMFGGSEETLTLHKLLDINHLQLSQGAMATNYLLVSTK